MNNPPGCHESNYDQSLEGVKRLPALLFVLETRRISDPLTTCRFPLEISTGKSIFTFLNLAPEVIINCNKDQQSYVPDGIWPPNRPPPDGSKGPSLPKRLARAGFVNGILQCRQPRLVIVTGACFLC